MLSGFSHLCLLLTFTGPVFCKSIPSFTRDDFPPDFVFGAGTSAYQVEGAVAEDGRTPSIWDTFTHAGKMLDKSSADVTCDQYHKYKEDVKLMSDTGLDAYRFSISWSRLLPNGRGPVNPKGLKYYNNLINELISYGIQPHVTIYHLDHPQALEDEYKGWLSPKIVDDFTAFADVLFREFGDRVSHWTTFNEPNINAIGGYDNGILPPRRCSPSFGIFNCTAGNSSAEPYIVGHRMLLAHASSARLYMRKYQPAQKGKIGINVYGFWCVPLTNSTADVIATQRALDFYIGWIVNPLVFGDYPQIMKQNVGSRLPSFTKEQSTLIKGSYDFLGLNHYTTIYIEDDPKGPKTAVRDFNTDMFVKITNNQGETPSSQFVPGFLPIIPCGMQGLLEYFMTAYENPPVYVQENGFGLPYNETLNDTTRVFYLTEYLNATQRAIRNGSNTKGYFVWSFLDVFELLYGYRLRYGLYAVDFEDKELIRMPTLSAQWFSNFLKGGKEMKIENGSLDVPGHVTE